MATNFVQEGWFITVAAPAAVTSGQYVAVGQLAGVAQTDAAIGEPVSLATQGVYNLAKTSAQAWAVGDAIYWDDATGEMTNVDTGVQVGVAVAVATNPTATGTVRLGLLMQPAYASY